MRRRSRRQAGLIAVVLTVTVTSLVGAPDALATHNKIVTFAARYCPTYDAIMANEARNNIMESLKDLGPNNTYGSSDAMDPDREVAHQPLCRPLSGWHFTMGTGIESRAVPGPWGSLSKVTSPYSTSIVTRDSVPLLNDTNGNTGRTIQGAVTIELTESQRAQAANANLWVMGGTPTQPVAEPETYAFGALRCGVDNLNGDNVEYVSYPTGATHVFCFAYYVRPAPASGTIIVRKVLSGAPPPTPPQNVRFTGNISYNTDRSFVVTARPDNPGEETFYRAGGATWSFTEDPPPAGQVFGGVTCTSSTGQSTLDTNPDPDERSASVGLAAGDVVMCTFTDTFQPPETGLTLRKVTLGKVGSFDFSIDGPEQAHQTITTETEGIPANGPEMDLEDGTYEIREHLPETARGKWSLQSVFCNTVEKSAENPVRVELTGSPKICTFTNRFTPAGSIRIHKVTLGDVTTTSFFVVPNFGVPGRYVQSATTTREGEPEPATGDDTSELPLGDYIIQELAPFVASPPGSWTLDAVVCDGLPIPSDQGRVHVQLTADHPDLDCTFTNVFTRPPEPPPPAPDTTPPPPAPTTVDAPAVSVLGATSASQQAVPKADLEVTKSATPRRLVIGATVRYVVTVTNRGPAAARNVTVVERQTYGNRRLRLRTSQGTCRGTPPRSCSIGTLDPGEEATITVTVRPRKTGRLRNVVAANTSTDERNVDGQAAAATVRVLPRPPAQFTG
jgi:hypothetical protein